MPTRQAPPAPFDVVNSLVVAYATNDRINRYLIDNVAPDAWTASPPGGKGRTIAAMVAHINNVRLMWLKSAGWPLDSVRKIDGDTCTKKSASEALSLSSEAVRTLLRASLYSDGRIKGFKPDAASFLGYLFAHDAHHRGQIAMLARQIGHPLSQSAMFGLWEWGTR
jgi:uncharacterized damage-inducible protein DinB